MQIQFKKNYFREGFWNCKYCNHKEYNIHIQYAKNGTYIGLIYSECSGCHRYKFFKNHGYYYDDFLFLMNNIEKLEPIHYGKQYFNREYFYNNWNTIFFP